MAKKYAYAEIPTLRDREMKLAKTCTKQLKNHVNVRILFNNYVGSKLLGILKQINIMKRRRTEL